MKVSILTVMFGILIVGCSEKEGRDVKTPNRALSKEEILEIAAKSAVSEDIPEQVKVVYDVNNQDWEKALERLKTEVPNAARIIRIKLRSRRYQAVYVYHSPPVMDGSYWMFFDKEKGNVITSFPDLLMDPNVKRLY